eukprot:7136704-Alexandrium_andersonii.AAC.1
MCIRDSHSSDTFARVRAGLTHHLGTFVADASPSSLWARHANPAARKQPCMQWKWRAVMSWRRSTSRFDANSCRVCLAKLRDLGPQNAASSR